LLVASEPLTDERITDLQASGIKLTCAAEIGYDVITFVTDVNNTLPEISRRDMASILSGSITNWSQVGGADQPIRILAREGSGTTELVLQSFTGMKAYQDHFIPCASNDECLDTALSTPGSLYWVSTTWLRTQPPRYLRPILIRRAANLPPEDPFSENFDPDNYTLELIRPLIMYVLRSDKIPEYSTNLAKEFLLFVRGVRGQEILENHHFYTYFDPPADVAVPLPADFGPGPDGLPIVCKP
jgi:ABC-type phosphate transport system substrate-binding protein